MRNFTLTDLAIGLAVPLTWGMGLVFAKAAVEHFPPILLMACRFSVTALVLVWFVRIPREQLRAICAIAFVSAALQYSFTFTGLKGLDASVTALVVQLEVPFLVLVGAVWLGERPSLRKWIGIALAFVGVGLMFGAPEVASSWFSVGLVVIGSFIWAVGQGMVRRLKNIDGMTLLAWVAVFAAPQLLVMSLIFESGQVTALRSAGITVWGAVIYLGVVMTAFGYTLWYSLLRKHPVGQVAPFLLLLPVASIAGGWLFLGESLGPLVVLGGVIVMGGVAFILSEDV